MSFEAYTDAGYGQFAYPSPAVQSPRDPISSPNAGADTVSPNGNAYKISQIWKNSTTNQLFIYNGSGTWIPLTNSSGGAPMLKMVTEAGNVVPDATGTFTLNGVTTTTTVGTDKLLTKNLTGSGDSTMGQVGINPSVAAGGSALANAGACSFANTQFVADANGFITLRPDGTNPAIVSVDVDAATGPGTDPVVADVNGQIHVTGSSPVAGTTPVRTNSLAANTYTIEVQKSQAIAATDATKVGLCNFNSSQFSVDANGFVSALASILGTSYPGLPSNLAFSKATNTTTFTGYDGTALSSTNKATFWINHPANRSNLVQISLTNPWQVIDAGGAGDMNGNSFGTSSGAWATDMPWYVYLVVNDAANAGAIAFSRVPHLTVAPAVGNCATRGSAVASTQGSMYFLDEVISGTPTAPTVANFDGNPCVCVGSFRVQKAAANDWVIQTPGNSDGIGLFQENVVFNYPTGQNGATAGSHFIEAGTFPAFSQKVFEYSINRSGLLVTQFTYANLTADGVGANDIVGTVPLSTLNSFNQAAGWFATLNGPLQFMYSVSQGNGYKVYTSNGVGAPAQNTDFVGTNAAAQWSGRWTYIVDIT